MYRNGRPEEPAFSPQELLFRRYRTEHWVEGQFSGLGFKFPKHSVNRGFFSAPEDVLFSDIGEFNGWSVLEFRVSDIPPPIQLPPIAFSFFMKHVPHEDNYAHSEIWSDRMNPSGEYVEPSPAVKKQFRTIMAQRMKVRIAAAI